MLNENKISVRRLNTKVNTFFKDINVDSVYAKLFPKAYSLASFFKDELKKRHRYMNKSNWDNTKTTATMFFSEVDYIKEEDLREAIIWFLDNEHHNVSAWWRRLRVGHLGSVLNNYNLWLDHHKEEEDKPGRKRYFKYG